MAHVLAGGGRLPGNKGHYGFADLILDKGGCFLFGAAAREPLGEFHPRALQELGISLSSPMCKVKLAESPSIPLKSKPVSYSWFPAQMGPPHILPDLAVIIWLAEIIDMGQIR
jgi:hypothetical protein